MKKTFVILAAMALAASACNNEKVEPLFEGQTEFCFAVDAPEMQVVSKADLTSNTKTDIQTSGFTCACVNNGDNSLNFNTTWAYKSDKGAYFAAQSYYYPASGTISCYAVYPSTTIGNDFKVSYTSDGTTDLLAAKVTNYQKPNPVQAINLTFNHALSEVKVQVVGTNTSLDYEVTKVEVIDAPTTGTLDLSADTWAAGTTKGNVTYSTTATAVKNDGNFSAKTGTMTKIGDTKSFIPGTAACKVRLSWVIKQGSNTLKTFTDVASEGIDLTKGAQNIINVYLGAGGLDEIYFTVDVAAWGTQDHHVALGD